MKHLHTIALCLFAAVAIFAFAKWVADTQILVTAAGRPMDHLGNESACPKCGDRAFVVSGSHYDFRCDSGHLFSAKMGYDKNGAVRTVYGEATP